MKLKVTQRALATLVFTVGILTVNTSRANIVTLTYDFIGDNYTSFDAPYTSAMAIMGTLTMSKMGGWLPNTHYDDLTIADSSPAFLSFSDGLPGNESWGDFLIMGTTDSHGLFPGFDWILDGQVLGGLPATMLLTSGGFGSVCIITGPCAFGGGRWILVSVEGVPEPSVVSLLGLGLLVLLMFRERMQYGGVGRHRGGD